MIPVNHNTALKQHGPFNHFEGNILLKNHIPKEKFTKFCNFKKDLLPPFTESQIFVFQVVESIEY